MIRRERPYRAVAFVVPDAPPDWPGAPAAVLVGRTAATRRRGLDRFVREHTERGHRVVVWKVVPLPGVMPS